MKINNIYRTRNYISAHLFINEWIKYSDIKEIVA